MTQGFVSPVILVILDGWGYRQARHDNAVALANTPIMDSLWEAYPHTLIHTSGKAVGLPEGQMGNSEVGHLNLGAGRIVPQELVRISDAVEDGSLLTNAQLIKLCQTVQSRSSKLHLIGLCSDGGVHSHIDHLLGLLDLAKDQGITNVCVQAITDGRDTNTKEGANFVATIQSHIEEIGVGEITTVSGRYFAMDRDHRWDRVKLAYDIMTQDGAGDGRSAEQVLLDFYAVGKTDEFIPPTRIAPGAIEAGDGVIFFNFRPDRARQLCYAFLMTEFDGFEREQIESLDFVTFTSYDPQLPSEVAFIAQDLNNILGEIVSRAGLKQFRTSETEKYPHVTYFFNGGLEEPYPGEDREMIPSPMVATYDRAPEMSAQAVTDIACSAIAKGEYSLIVMNYANPDMVGHTGKLDVSIQAIETVDTCLGQLLQSTSQMGGTALITADHGNAEYMKDEEGNPWTAHTTNPVPFILVEGEGKKIPGRGAAVKLKDNGRLADIAPTILEILQLPQPVEMTGESLLEPALVKLVANRTPVKLSR